MVTGQWACKGNSQNGQQGRRYCRPHASPSKTMVILWASSMGERNEYK